MKAKKAAKATAKKTAAKKAAVKKVIKKAAKKIAPVKKLAKKAVKKIAKVAPTKGVKKTTPKKATRKTAAKKSSVKKAAAKKSAAKKAPAKKAAVRKSAVKKAPVKKSVAKRAVAKTIAAKLASTPPYSGPAWPLMDLILAALDDAKAENTVAINLEGRSAMADGMVVTTGRVNRHVAAIADQLLGKLKIFGTKNVRVEGLETGDWCLVDTGDIIVHIFRPEVRSFYNLEKLWSADAPHERSE